MPTITAGRPADVDEIRSYADIVAAHHALVTKVVAGKGASYADAAKRVRRLGRLYRQAHEVTDEIRDVAEKSLAAARLAAKATPVTSADVLNQFNVADGWLDRLDLLVHAPTDGR